MTGADAPSDAADSQPPPAPMNSIGVVIYFVTMVMFILEDVGWQR
ncbi:MAG: hypothetical protein ABGX04_11120 [Myxococcales bacterium]